MAAIPAMMPMMASTATMSRKIFQKLYGRVPTSSPVRALTAM
jgi:hypothetical protein